jgi:hypothetical protein
MSTSATSTARLAGALLLALAAAGCAPDVPYTAPPASVVTAVFDPTTGDIPLPSDLLLLDPASLPGVPAAEKELLGVFKAQGGFPNDQEVAVTISFARDLLNADGSTTRVAPTLDPASFTPGTFFVFGVTAAGPGVIETGPIQAGDFTTGPGQVTTLTLHNKGGAPWAPGQYAVLVRGGTYGVKTVEGDPVNASSVFYLVAQGNDMTQQQNLILLQAQTGSYDSALALANQLNGLIAGYQPAFAACDTRFPHQELAALAGFTIAPAQTQVDLDPGRGLVPLPIDLLRDPRPASPTCAACGRLTPLAACTLAQGTINPTTGDCSSPAAAGFAALDGFSTTAPILAPTNDLVLAGTVTAATYKLYDLSNPASPVLVNPATYLTEPSEFTQSGVSPVVASQPVGATATDATSPFRTVPLKDNTSYAVVITSGVKGKAGNALKKGTVANVLLFDNPLVDASGHSQLTGIDDATAGALEVMRQQLLPVRTALAAASPAVPKSDIAMAYTFKTQSFTLQAAQLGALPYQAAQANPAGALPIGLSVSATNEIFVKYGVDPAIPASNIDEVLETDILTYNLLDPQTGAFNPDPSKAQAERIHVIVTTPKTAPACTGGLAPFGKCAPLMVFRHGLGGGRQQMLLAADTYAAKGMVTVAIDAAKHGDRAYCTTGSTNQCLPGSTCQAVPGFTTQGDTTVPGRCTLASGSTGNGDGFPVRNAVTGANCATGGTCTIGIPAFSANYLISANFFRTRDTFRQDIIDQSQLILALAFAPSGAPPTGHAVFDHMVGRGLVIDPARVYYSGQSLGAIQGTVDVAAIPRIQKAVLNVGGGTLVDVFTTSPAFASTTNALLAGLGIAPGSSAYLQFLAVAKLILDPADPVNYAGHLTANTLPNLIPPLGGAIDGTVKQLAKKVLTQAALCDQVVPNTWNYVLDHNAGSAPLPGATGFGGPGTFQLFMKPTADPAAAIAACGSPTGTSAFAQPHGFLLDWSNPALAAKVQGDAAAFVVDDTNPLSLIMLP